MFVKLIFTLIAVGSLQVCADQNMLKTNEDEDGGGIVMETSKPLVIQCTPKTNDGKTPETSDGMTAEMKWKKDGQEINSTDVHREIVSANNSLVIASPNDEDTGNYTCYLHNDPSKYRVISVRTSPQVEKFQKSMNVAEGDTLTLICKVIAGIPMPSVMWYKGADSINGSHGRIHLSTYTNAKIQVENSKLVIENVEFDDRAQYKCVATNAVSADFSTILVRVKDKYAALWPFLGICAEVAVLCTIIFVYEKRRTKPDFEESDTDNCPDGKNTTDHKNQELRQRK